MANERVFDQPLQAELRDARAEFLRRVLPPLQLEHGLRTALDVGCGVGSFSATLKDLGFEVTAADARAENIAEARTRHPGIQFRVANAEDDSLQQLGRFDLVLCFGLLYHLENPLRAMRNFRALAGKLLLIESMSLPDDQPFLYLLDEPAGQDQSLRAVSCYPSDGAILKMAYCAGFPHVYRFRELPRHDLFRPGLGRMRARTVIAASVPELRSSLIVAAPEPKSSGDLWTTDRTGITKAMRRFRHHLKRTRAKARS